MSWRLLFPAALLHGQRSGPPPPALSPSPSPPLPDLSSIYYPQSAPPPSSTFPYSDLSSPFVRLFRRVVLTAVHGSCRLHQRLNRVHVLDASALLALLHRPPHCALLTLSNHASTIDDPYIISALTPWPVLVHPTLSRWSWCTEDICFSSAPRSALFRLGKILPVNRGRGLHQRGMVEALAHLCEGDWLHVFPEGRCFPHPALLPHPLRWGAAVLAVQALALGTDVRVLPVMHCGMEEVMPLYARIPLPRVGKDVWVLVGEEVDVRGVVERWRKAERANAGWGDPWPQKEEALYAEVARLMEEAMRRTGEELRRRVGEQSVVKEEGTNQSARVALLRRLSC